MPFHVCDSGSVSGSCLMALYFAPIDAASNSGRVSSQIFRTSSLITATTFLDAKRKAFVRSIEFDLLPRGDDWMCKTFILLAPNVGTSARPLQSKPPLLWDVIRTQNGSRPLPRPRGWGRLLPRT